MPQAHLACQTLKERERSRYRLPLAVLCLVQLPLKYAAFRLEQQENAVSGKLAFLCTTQLYNVNSIMFVGANSVPTGISNFGCDEEGNFVQCDAAEL